MLPLGDDAPPSFSALSPALGVPVTTASVNQSQVGFINHSEVWTLEIFLVVQ